MTILGIMTKKRQLGSFVASAFLSQLLYAADFTIGNGQVVTTTQTLTDNEIGTIETEGQLNTGANTAVNATGLNNTVHNSGSITTSGIGASSIVSTGDGATITNSGSVTTLAAGATGIDSTGSQVTIINSGSLATAGNFANAIQLDGLDATVSNTGDISTAGQLAIGIYSVNDHAAISNGGNITTSGDTAFGIVSVGNDIRISNDGNITTSGSQAYGIGSNSNNAHISNNGAIATSGSEAYGIIISGNNSYIGNDGNIVTSGDLSGGIYADADNANIANTGSIFSSGYLSDGIDLFGDNAILSNSGSITVSGDDAVGVYSNAANAFINNSGLIRATGAGSYAILGVTNDIVLNLLSGSRIIGAIDLGDGGGDLDTVNIYGNAVSGNMTFQNTEVVNLLDGATGVVVTNGFDKTVTTMDSTGESTRGVVLADLTTDIHRVLAQRIVHDVPFNAVNVASLEPSFDLLFASRKPVAWVQAFGGSFSRERDGSALAYQHSHTGVSFGYEQDFNQKRAGFMGGYARTNADTDIASFKTDSDHFFVGAYSVYRLKGNHLAASIVAGYADYANKRLVIDNLFGTQVAKSDFNSFFISPSVTIASDFAISDSVVLRPSATVNYTFAWLDGYTEKGTTNSNLKVNDRKIKALTARAQLEGVYYFSKVSEVALKIGANFRNINDDKTNVSLAGHKFSFANSGDDNVAGGFAGVNFRAIAPNHFNMIVDIELGGNTKEDYVNGYIGLEYVF